MNSDTPQAGHGTAEHPTTSNPSSQPAPPAAPASSAADEASKPTKIRIGSQRWTERNPAARPKPAIDLHPARPRPTHTDEAHEPAAEAPAAEASPAVAAPAPHAEAEHAAVAPELHASSAAPATDMAETPSGERRPERPRGPGPDKSGRPPRRQKPPVVDVPPAGARVPTPNLRAQLTPELEQELADALGGMSVDDMLTADKQVTDVPELEPDSRHRARVLTIHQEDVFVDLGGRRQGVLSLQNFTQTPEEGFVFDVVVARFLPSEGLYELTMPGSAVRVEDWSQVHEGMLVDAQVTGHNKGGLECQVNNLRGFIPASQASLYRVEDMAQFVGQKLTCVVTEANPDKRNLVLSHRAMLERQKAEAKANLLSTLEVGQIREGIVRSLQEFGAFVDLGGIDGLIHISQLSWERIRHASEALELGQKVRVKIQKIDPETGKIGLAFRDLAENPWTTAGQKFPVRSRVRGTVTRITEFGAFVRLESGIEGLVHISELSHKRVFRVTDVLSEGQEIEVQVVSVDPAQQRISLSLKALEARAVSAKKEDEPEPEEAPVVATKRKTPLKGGIGRDSGGQQFGLKW